MDGATEKVLRTAIKSNIPVRFSYWSYASKRKKGFEKPTHERVSQPVAVGQKLTKRGVKDYFRAYLLGMYSYSRDIFFTTYAKTNKDTNKIFWRVYDIDKCKNIRLEKKWTNNDKFWTGDHPEYNPKDKFFTKVSFAMAPGKKPLLRKLFGDKDEKGEGEEEVADKKLLVKKPEKKPLTKPLPKDKDKELGEDEIEEALRGFMGNVLAEGKQFIGLYESEDTEEIALIENGKVFINYIWIKKDYEDCENWLVLI